MSHFTRMNSPYTHFTRMFSPYTHFIRMYSPYTQFTRMYSPYTHFTRMYSPNTYFTRMCTTSFIMMCSCSPCICTNPITISRENCSFRKGSNGACNVNEWVESFPPTGEKVKFKMTSVCGHVMSLDFDSKFNSWDK